MKPAINATMPDPLTGPENTSPQQEPGPVSTDRRSTLSSMSRKLRALVEPELLEDSLPGLAPLAKRAVLDEVRLALDEGDGFAVRATAPRAIPRETLDAIEASTRRALTRAGLPVRPPTSDNGPRIWLSCSVERRGRIRVTRTSLRIGLIALRFDHQGYAVMVACYPYASEILDLCGGTEAFAQVTRDARKLVSRFIKELKADPIRPDQP